MLGIKGSLLCLWNWAASSCPSLGLILEVWPPFSHPRFLQDGIFRFVRHDPLASHCLLSGSHWLPCVLSFAGWAAQTPWTMLACTGTWGALLPISLNTGTTSASAWVISMVTAESMSECMALAYPPPVCSLALGLISGVSLSKGDIVIVHCGWHFSGRTSGFLPSARICLCQTDPGQHPNSAHLVQGSVDDEQVFQNHQVFPSCFGVWAQRTGSIAMTQNLNWCL